MPENIVSLSLAWMHAHIPMSVGREGKGGTEREGRKKREIKVKRERFNRKKNSGANGFLHILNY